MKKLFSINLELNKVTGVQKVMLDIHHAVKGEYDAKIVGNISYDKIDTNHHILKDEYVKFSTPFMFRNSIVIVHERKLLFLFWLLNSFFFQKIKLVYIHHNIFHDKKWMCIMPDTVVALADKGIENLREYFGVPNKNIHKIFNCVRDIKPQEHKKCNKETVKILYPARINSTKRQIEIVNALRGNIRSNVIILFAGVGPCYDEFAALVKDDNQFVSLGFRSDIYSLMQECDYIMLFSKHEGLPITLIEATMCGTPIICNDVGGNSEIAINGYNAFVSPNPDDWKWLVDTINSLLDMDENQYVNMSRNSRQIYENKFTFEKFKKKYLELLSEL